ncbi:RnfH family protein [Lysobacter sp. F6437]|uniref:RnfH family protein n=1 Tax=Lysobacter sp. F6437 TaxID=3459296 RepID=UPI00403E33FA
MKVELIRAWPRRFETMVLELDEGACVADALRAAGWAGTPGSDYAVFGVVADGSTMLRDGDRVELLRPLLADPKEARRRRAASRGR